MAGDACDELIQSVSRLIRESQKTEEIGNGVLLRAKALIASIAAHIGDDEGGDIDLLVQSLLERANETMQTEQAVAMDDDEESSSEDESEKEMAKPQEAWKDSINNDRAAPFVPLLKRKPNAIVPLKLRKVPILVAEEGGEEEEEVCGSVIGPSFSYAHPYEHELNNLTYRRWQLEDASSISVASYKSRLSDPSHPFEYVDKEDDFDRLVVELEGRMKVDKATGRQDCRELAIDLEHHTLRSYQGITCLMQLSSRDKDWIIDTIALRSEMHRLNSVFTDPAVVKVMHGCRNDVLWLQKDFGLYLVNVFDTYFASKALEFPHLSLKYLLKKYCNVDVDKRHQTADWRTRPLDKDLLKYAKNDTHYLLYVYDSLRRDLSKKQNQLRRTTRDRAEDAGLVVAVLNSSKNLCLQRYEKEAFRPRGYLKLFKREDTGAGGGNKARSGFLRPSEAQARLSQAQVRCLDSLYDWRDRKARAEDESPGFILSNTELIAVGSAVPLTAEALHAVYAKHGLGQGQGQGGFRPMKKSRAVDNDAWRRELLDAAMGLEVAAKAGEEGRGDVNSDIRTLNTDTNNGGRGGAGSMHLGVSDISPVSLFTRRHVVQRAPYSSSSSSSPIPRPSPSDVTAWFPCLSTLRKNRKSIDKGTRAGQSTKTNKTRSADNRDSDNDRAQHRAHAHAHAGSADMLTGAKEGLVRANAHFRSMLEPVLAARKAVTDAENTSEGEEERVDDMKMAAESEKQKQKHEQEGEREEDKREFIFNTDSPLTSLSTGKGRAGTKRKWQPPQVKTQAGAGAGVGMGMDVDVDVDVDMPFDYGRFERQSDTLAAIPMGTGSGGKGVNKQVRGSTGAAPGEGKPINPYLPTDKKKAKLKGKGKGKKVNGEKEKVERRHISSHVSH